MILAEGLWDELGDHGVDALAYVVGATSSSTWYGVAPGGYTDAKKLSALQARILQPATPEEVAARLFTVLPHGPRQYSNLADEAAAQENSSKSRAEAVQAIGAVTTGSGPVRSPAQTPWTTAASPSESIATT